MQFSAMTMNMFFPQTDERTEDHSIIDMAVRQTIWLAELGYNPWFTDHHFRGPWHSNPLQFAAYIAPQIPDDRYLGFGVLSVPFYHPVRLVESMNLLDHLAKGKVLFGVGSGWAGVEPDSLGVDPEYHSSGKAAEDTLEVMDRLWAFQTGDPEYSFSVGSNSGRIKRRLMPSSFTGRRPTIIWIASRDTALVSSAKKGLPVFLGALGADLQAQAKLYRDALSEANHSPEVVQHCLNWCSCDWLSVVIGETDQQARADAQISIEEQLMLRKAFIDRHGETFGATSTKTSGKETAASYANGSDLLGTIAGSPETVAAKVQELADQGINHLHLRFRGEWTGKTEPPRVCQRPFVLSYAAMETSSSMT